MLAVLGTKPNPVVCPLPARTADLGLRIFEREIPVPGSVRYKVGQLAFNNDFPKLPFKLSPNLRRQL
jgi:hypothetical protein